MGQDRTTAEIFMDWEIYGLSGTGSIMKNVLPGQNIIEKNLPDECEEVFLVFGKTNHAKIAATNQAHVSLTDTLNKKCNLELTTHFNHQ